RSERRRRELAGRRRGHARADGAGYARAAGLTRRAAADRARRGRLAGLSARLGARRRRGRQQRWAELQGGPQHSRLPDRDAASQAGGQAMRRRGVGSITASPTMVGALTVMVVILAVFLAY